MTLTTLRRRLSDAYGVIYQPIPVFYGWGLDGGTLHAVTIAGDGALAEERGTTSGVTPAGQLSPIVLDSEELVGPGSVAWAEEPGSIRVWDVVGETVHEWDSSPACHTVTPPVYYSGYLYWWTVTIDSASQTTARFWRARADLSSPTMIEDIVLAMSPTIDYFDAGTARFVLESSGAAMRATYTDPNPDGSWRAAYRCAIAGGSTVADTDGDDVEVLLGWPVASDSVGIEPEATLSSVDAVLGDVPAAIWSTSGDWALSQPQAAGLAADGTTAVVVDQVAHCVHASTTAPGADPLHVFDYVGDLTSLVLAPIPED